MNRVGVGALHDGKILAGALPLHIVPHRHRMSVA